MSLNRKEQKTYDFRSEARTSSMADTTPTLFTLRTREMSAREMSRVVTIPKMSEWNHTRAPLEPVTIKTRPLTRRREAR